MDYVIQFTEQEMQYFMPFAATVCLIALLLASVCWLFTASLVTMIGYFAMSKAERALWREYQKDKKHAEYGFRLEMKQLRMHQAAERRKKHGL